MGFKGLCNLGQKQTAFTGGVLTAATGSDRLFTLPVYQRAVHWGLGGLIAPMVLSGQDITTPISWDGAQKAGLGIIGGASYYSGIYFLSTLLGQRM